MRVIRIEAAFDLSFGKDTELGKLFRGGEKNFRATKLESRMFVEDRY